MTANNLKKDFIVHSDCYNNVDIAFQQKGRTRSVGVDIVWLNMIIVLL